MRVRCISNAYQALPSTSIHYVAECGAATFALKLGEDYTVYAVWGRGTETLYSILDDERAGYPKWFPAVLFEVVDGRLPTCWRYAQDLEPETRSSCFLIAFPEWINDRMFNENLVEGDPLTKRIWQRYRVQIANESQV
jgi:hypothetical protein